MSEELTIGNPTFAGTDIVIRLEGSLNMDTMDKLGEALEDQYKRSPPGITLDCSKLSVNGHGIKELIHLQQSHSRCKLKLIRVAPRYRMAFESKRVSETGIEINYANEGTDEKMET